MWPNVVLNEREESHILSAWRWLALRVLLAQAGTEAVSLSWACGSSVCVCQVFLELPFLRSMTEDFSGLCLCQQFFI